jgi:hypothetical protein
MNDDEFRKSVTYSLEQISNALFLLQTNHRPAAKISFPDPFTTILTGCGIGTAFAGQSEFSAAMIALLVVYLPLKYIVRFAYKKLSGGDDESEESY